KFPAEIITPLDMDRDPMVGRLPIISGLEEDHTRGICQFSAVARSYLSSPLKRFVQVLEVSEPNRGRYVGQMVAEAHALDVEVVVPNCVGLAALAIDTIPALNACPFSVLRRHRRQQAPLSGCEN